LSKGELTRGWFIRFAAKVALKVDCKGRAICFAPEMERRNMMGSPVEIKMPKYPECWTACGSCANGNIVVQSVLVSPGSKVKRDDTLIVLETGKVAIDIPSPHDGIITEVRVQEYDPIGEGEVIALIEVS
jgi:pyruvate dehydrogenase E2 component (dihydrolipoamide acetyltransferase)